MKSIKKIRYNWHPIPGVCQRTGAEAYPEGQCASREVGVGGVTRIEFFDKTYCIVHYADGHKEIQFNLNNIVFEGEKNENN